MKRKAKQLVGRAAPKGDASHCGALQQQPSSQKADHSERQTKRKKHRMGKRDEPGRLQNTRMARGMHTEDRAGSKLRSRDKNS